MAKIGTAHIEIKPVLSDEALDLIAERIEAAVRAGVEAGMKAAERPTFGDVHISTGSVDESLDAIKRAARLKHLSGRGGPDDGRRR